jgi:hypothetical protein
VLALARFGPDEGATFVDFRPHDDLAWRVLAVGYREAEGELQPVAAVEETPLITVRLSPGFHRELTVHSTLDGRHLGNVVIRDEDGTELARSSSDGQVVLSAAEWPGVLSIEHPAFVSIEWDANDPWSNATDQLWLTPLE